MTAYLRAALRQTRLFSRSGLTRHLGLLYRTVQPTIVLFLLVLALTGCLSEDIPTEKETTLVRVGEKAPHFTVGMLDDTAIPVRPARQRGVAYLLLHVVPDLPGADAADANPNRRSLC